MSKELIEETRQWMIRGKDFSIVVKHVDRPILKGIWEGTNCWTLYAYIYPEHPLFTKLLSEKINELNYIYNDLICSIPLHNGCTWYNEYYDSERNPIRIEVGVDYCHYGDQEYMMMSTKEEAEEIFKDADKLYDFCASYKI